MSKAIRYRDTLAMPGSQLHRLLSENKSREAEASYRETEARHKELMLKADRQSMGDAVTDSRCGYLNFKGKLCNKCGRVHDGLSRPGRESSSTGSVA